MAEAVRVLRAVEPALAGIRLTLEELPAGAEEFRRRGDPLPAETLAACRAADAVLIGPMGLPEIRWPDGREISPQLDLREQLNLYCGLRPLRLFHAADSPLKFAAGGEIDLLIVRENSEGLFSSRREPMAGGDQAQDVLRVSRRGSQRLFRAAFREARRRRGHVTLVDKANVLPSMVLFRAVFNEVADEFPGVRAQRLYVDAAALLLVQRPQSFDVLVTENMFGDILSDLAAALVGGMGMAPSADVGDARAVFGAAHGSAPDIAGRGIANPTAMILSTAMMLEWLGRDSTRSAAERIRRAVAAVLSDPERRTPDLGGPLTTRELGDAVLAALLA
jgi:3-isopropylmalate dehydrogenase